MTPSNRSGGGVEEHSYRLLAAAGGVKNATASGPGGVVTTHRSVSRENASVMVAGLGTAAASNTNNATSSSATGSYGRKSTAMGGKHNHPHQTASSQAHHTPINAGSVSTNRVA